MDRFASSLGLGFALRLFSSPLLRRFLEAEGKLKPLTFWFLLQPYGSEEFLLAEFSTDKVDQRRGTYAPIGNSEDPQLGLYDKPMPCFGCGIGWFCLLLGFLFPPMWYFGTVLYFGSYYRRDPRERAGLAASAIAALICTVAGSIVAVVLLLT